MGKTLKGGRWKVDKEQLKSWLPTLYYYFFYGALGALFPFLNLFYRAVGMDPWQIGILGGIRPLIALLFAPLWSALANRCRRRKTILVASLISWIMFTMPLTFLRHSEGSEPCPGHFNSSEIGFETSEDAVHNRKIIQLIENMSFDGNLLSSSSNSHQVKGEINANMFMNLAKRNEKLRNNNNKTLMPIGNNLRIPAKIQIQNGKITERKPYDFKSRGSPYYNKRKNPFADTIFTEFVFIVLFGEVFQSPTDDLNTHFDGTFLEHLGVLYQNAASNMVYSSIGIGVASFSTGLILRFAPKIPICDEEYANYKWAFIIFSALMLAALVISFKFDFSYRRRRRSFARAPKVHTATQLFICCQPCQFCNNKFTNTYNF